MRVDLSNDAFPLSPETLFLVAFLRQAIADLDGVAEVYSCAGNVDLIAVVKVREHEHLADVIAGGLSKVPGVRQTDTHIAFRSYASRDVEEGFSVGQD